MSPYKVPVSVQDAKEQSPERNRQPTLAAELLCAPRPRLPLRPPLPAFPRLRPRAPRSAVCRLPPAGVSVSRTPWVVLLLTGAASSEGPWLHQSAARWAGPPCGVCDKRSVLRGRGWTEDPGERGAERRRAGPTPRAGEATPPRPPRLSRRRQSEPPPQSPALGIVTQGLATSGRPPARRILPARPRFSRPNHTLGAAQSRSPRDRDTPPAISLAPTFLSSLKFLINPKGKKSAESRAAQVPTPTPTPPHPLRRAPGTSDSPLVTPYPDFILCYSSNKIIHAQSKFNLLQSPPISPLWLEKKKNPGQNQRTKFDSVAATSNLPCPVGPGSLATRPDEAAG